MRLYDGDLVAHADPELADRLIASGDAESFRRGPRRYLRLRRGIHVPRTVHGWDVIEYLRWYNGDRRTAQYVAHSDHQSERLRYQSPSQPSQKLGAMWLADSGNSRLATGSEHS